MPDNTISIEDSINQAMGSLPLPPGATRTEEPKIPTTEPNKEVPLEAEGAESPRPEKTAAPETPKVPEDSEEDKVMMRQLYQGLKDPTKAPTIIEFLAKQAGYVKPPETPKEAAKQEQAIGDILKEALGEEFNFLAPRLDKAFEAIAKRLESKQEAANKQFDERIADQERIKYENEAARTEVALAQLYFEADKFPDAVEVAMSKLMDDFPPNGTMTTEQYMKHIFHMVAGEQGLTIKKSAAAVTAERTNKNRTDAPSRLASQGAKPVLAAPVSTKNLTLEQSIAAAIDTVEKKSA